MDNRSRLRAKGWCCGLLSSWPPAKGAGALQSSSLPPPSTPSLPLLLRHHLAAFPASPQFTASLLVFVLSSLSPLSRRDSPVPGHPLLVSSQGPCRAATAGDQVRWRQERGRWLRVVTVVDPNRVRENLNVASAAVGFAEGGESAGWNGTRAGAFFVNEARATTARPHSPSRPARATRPHTPFCFAPMRFQMDSLLPARTKLAVWCRRLLRSRGRLAPGPRQAPAANAPTVNTKPPVCAGFGLASNLAAAVHQGLQGHPLLASAPCGRIHKRCAFCRSGPGEGYGCHG